ncbi:hypothetical protein SAMN05421493_10757 [Pseudobutyrivibrio sp. 49]|nr:hypothetical protein SAMN05421493_10757 [Pseudobutyrivibrio sp. 49]
MSTRIIKDATGVDLITATGTEINSLNRIDVYERAAKTAPRILAIISPMKIRINVNNMDCQKEITHSSPQRLFTTFMGDAKRISESKYIDSSCQIISQNMTAQSLIVFLFFDVVEFICWYLSTYSFRVLIEKFI